MLASFFGAMALLLAAVGLHGTLLQAVTNRTGEIGVRVALGARPVDIGWLVGRQVLWMLSTGLAIGVPTAWVGSRLVAASLYRISAVDPVVLVGAVGTLALAALIAVYSPLRKALFVNPVDALR